MTWDWAEPDHRLQHEVILWAQLHDRSLEPRGSPDPTELSETAGDGGWSTPSLHWWVTPPNTLVRVWDALTSLWRGAPHVVWGTIFCKWRTLGEDLFICIWLTLQWEKANGHACESWGPLETSPGHSRLAPWNQRASWLK